MGRKIFYSAEHVSFKNEPFVLMAYIYGTILVSEPEYELPREFPREINPFGDHLRPVSAAVMLSPPVRSRVMEPERDVNPNASMLLFLITFPKILLQ